MAVRCRDLAEALRRFRSSSETVHPPGNRYAALASASDTNLESNTAQVESFAYGNTTACGRNKELRIARWDELLTPYSQEEFLDYYTPKSGWKIWQEAVTYKDGSGNIRHVLVRIENQKRWGLVDRLSQESVLLAGMLKCDDEDPVLDLGTIIGCDLCFNICRHILDYLCGCESDWWEKVPSMGALDVADKLGLERLLFSIVRPLVEDEWKRARLYLHASG